MYICIHKSNIQFERLHNNQTEKNNNSKSKCHRAKRTKSTTLQIVISHCAHIMNECIHMYIDCLDANDCITMCHRHRINSPTKMNVKNTLCHVRALSECVWAFFLSSSLFSKITSQFFFPTHKWNALFEAEKKTVTYLWNAFILLRWFSLQVSDHFPAIYLNKKKRRNSLWMLRICVIFGQIINNHEINLWFFLLFSHIRKVCPSKKKKKLVKESNKSPHSI